MRMCKFKNERALLAISKHMRGVSTMRTGHTEFSQSFCFCLIDPRLVGGSETLQPSQIDRCRKQFLVSASLERKDTKAY